MKIEEHIEEPGAPRLLEICRWGRSFYGEAAQVSLDSKLSNTLHNLELQRAILGQELLRWEQTSQVPHSPLITLVRSSPNDDLEILNLCERMDQETITAYQVERAKAPPGQWRSLLDRHLGLIQEGRARHAALLKTA